VKRYVIVGDEQAAIAELRGLASKSAAEATPELQLVSHGTKPGSEYAAIKRALAQSGGNRKVAAGILNISYKELIFKMRDYGLNVPRRTTATGVPRVN
jgi:DNA-binding NtrC family response regulator